MRISAALLTTLLLASAARAQEGAPPEYRPMIDEAVREFGAAHWEEARALFRRAHELYPNARTLRGMGMASFELRDYLGALRALTESRRDDRQPLTADQRRQVDELLDRTRSFIATYRFRLPAGATITVDGVPTELEENGTLLLPAGTREVRVRGRDGREAMARLEIEGGERGRLPIDLTPLTSRAPRARESEFRPVQWTLVIGGLVLAGGGGVMLGVGVADLRSVEAASFGTPWNDLEEAYYRAPILTGTGVALLGVGGAAVAIGLIWFLTDAPSVEVRAGLDRLEVRGRF